MHHRARLRPVKIQRSWTWISYGASLRHSGVRIRVPQQTIDDWLRRLTRAGLHEIGGVLFGEQICEGTFRHCYSDLPALLASEPQYVSP